MRILNFYDFILESFKKLEVPFQISSEFRFILNEIDSPISSEFLNLIESASEITLLNIGETNDTATFTTSSKIVEHFKTSDFEQLKTFIKPLTKTSMKIYHLNRSYIRIGRLIRKIFSDKFSDIEIENFVNQYKSILDSKILKFQTWTGNDIIKGYSSNLYTHDGSRGNPLMNSCMNDKSRIIEFYKYVPVELLVLLNDEGHIYGRALIWKTDKGLFMDRVYTAFDSDYYKFINFAKDHDIIYKSENKSGAKINYIKGQEELWFNMKIDLNFDIMDDPNDIPYMDTFIYAQDNYLSNYEPEDGEYLLLQDTEGDPELVLPYYDIYGRRIIGDMSYYVFSNTQNGWIFEDDAKWVRCVGDYLSLDYLNNPDNGFIFSDESRSYIKIK
jgi:hypothetical protein